MDNKKSEENTILHGVIAAAIFVIIAIIGIIVFETIQSNKRPKENYGKIAKKSKNKYDKEKNDNKITYKDQKIKKVCGEKSNICFEYNHVKNWSVATFVEEKDENEKEKIKPIYTEKITFLHNNYRKISYITILTPEKHVLPKLTACKNKELRRNVVKVSPTKVKDIYVYAFVDRVLNKANSNDPINNKYIAKILLAQKILNIKSSNNFLILDNSSQEKVWNCQSEKIIKSVDSNFIDVSSYTKLLFEKDSNNIFNSEKEATDWINNQENTEVFNILKTYHRS